VVRSGSDLLAFKANFNAAQLKHSLLPVLMFVGGYGGMVTAGDGVTTVAGCIRRDRLEALRCAWPGLSAGDTFEAMLRRECAGVRNALRSSERQGTWLATRPLAPGIRVGVDDQIFRIGNAAGEAHPILGEGMSMALQSAWLLCKHLLAPVSGDAGRCPAWQSRVAREYATDWRRLFQTRIRLAGIFAHAAMRPLLSAPLLTMAHHWPSLLTLGAIQGGKTRSIVTRSGVTLNESPCPSTPTERTSHEVNS
jgi:flavin-dependent dehydrogenase